MTSMQTDRQTDKDTYTDTGIDTHTHTHTHECVLTFFLCWGVMVVRLPWFSNTRHTSIHSLTMSQPLVSLTTLAFLQSRSTRDDKSSLTANSSRAQSATASCYDWRTTSQWVAMISVIEWSTPSCSTIGYCSEGDNWTQCNGNSHSNLVIFF